MQTLELNADKLGGPFALVWGTQIIWNELWSREQGGINKDLKHLGSTFNIVPSALDCQFAEAFDDCMHNHGIF